MRVLPGLVLAAGLAACSTTGLAPIADAPEMPDLGDIARKYDFTGDIKASLSGTGPLPVQSFGMRQAEDRIWPWASITKQVMAVLTMQQVEAGVLDLDTPISVYLDDWSAGGPQAPSMRQLLRHQSGFRQQELNEPIALTNAGIPDTLEVTRTVMDPAWCLEDRAEPGGEFAYNNCDTIWVGKVLENITGMPVSALFRDGIADPAGMRDTQFIEPDTAIPFGRGTRDNEIIALHGASAALTGTAADLLAFDRALMSGRMLSSDSLAEMWDGIPQLGYSALGQWSFTSSLAGCSAPVRIVERRGTVLSRYQARNFILPQKDLAIVVFMPEGEEDFAFGEIWKSGGFSYDLLSKIACGNDAS